MNLKTVILRLTLITVMAVGALELFSPTGVSPALAQGGTIAGHQAGAALQPPKNTEPELQAVIIPETMTLLQ